MKDLIEKFTNRAIAEIKFCNSLEEENDTIFDWCV